MTIIDTTDPLPSPSAPTGAIYDLGYQRYTGQRRGRRYALWSLYALSVRNAFGIGRGTVPKVMTGLLVLLAHVPAFVVLVVAAVFPVEFEFVRPEDYYGSIQFILVLFIAGISSDLVGNDRRSGTLALYFSRPIKRDDYVLAKIAALATSLLALTISPQLVMFGGNALGSSNVIEWMLDNAADLPRIVASGSLLCLTFASIGILIASYTERRAFAMIGVTVFFFVAFTVVSIVASVFDHEQIRYVLLASPLHVVTGATLFIFDAIPEAAGFTGAGGPRYQIAGSGFPAYAWPLAALAWTGGASAIVIRRYRGAI